jgi:hypothetical protein
MCATPRAAASAIADLVSQSSGVRPDDRFPATHSTEKENQHDILHSYCAGVHRALQYNFGCRWLYVFMCHV